MSNSTQDSQSELGNILDDLVNMEKPARFHNTDWAEYNIEAYVTTRVKEALEKVQNVCESHDSEFAFNLANAIEDRVQVLTTTTNGKEE